MRVVAVVEAMDLFAERDMENLAYRVFFDNGQIWLYRPHHDMEYRWVSESPLCGVHSANPIADDFPWEGE